MSGRGIPRGSHRSSLAVLNHSLPGSADQNLTPNAEQMNTQGSSVSGEHAQPEEGSAPLINLPEEGVLEDAVPIGDPTVPFSQSVVETPNTFAATNQGESQTTVVARLTEEQSLADWAERARLFKLLMLILNKHC
jgi:hypothetical protein